MNTIKFLRMIPVLSFTAITLSACAMTTETPNGVFSSSSSSSDSETVVGIGCAIGGCSSEICSDASSEPMMSTCIFKEEYACYKTARCEKQAGGTCGWTRTDSLTTCIANAKSES